MLIQRGEILTFPETLSLVLRGVIPIAINPISYASKISYQVVGMCVKSSVK